MAALEDLIKTTKEENAKTRALNEKLASGRRENNQFASNEEITVAKESLKKEDDLISLQKRTLNISSDRFEEARELGIAIKAQETVMKEQSDSLELLGITASEDDNYKKEEQKLAKMQLQLAKTTGSKDAEKGAKDKLGENKMLTYMKNTAGFLGGIAKQGMQKVKSGLGGFSKFLFGALAVAALAFLDHPKFKEMISLLIDTLIPLAVTFYEEVLVPVGAALAKLFKDIMGYLKDGKPSLMSILMDNKLAILGIITALAPGLVFGALKFAVMGIGKAVVFLVSKLSFAAIFAKIGVAFAAIKTFFVATLFPFLTKAVAILGPLGIAAVIAGIALVLYSLKQAFDDFMFELEATGSIWEATKTGIVSVISNILGLPFDLLKDGVSWIIGKIGSVFGLESFTNASKVLDEFSFVDSMRDMLTFLGDSIAGVFDGFMQVIQDFLRSGALGFLGGDKAADILFGTKEKQATEKKIEEAQQKRMVEDRKALRQKQKLDKAAEKAAEEAKKLEKIKAEQEAKQAKQRKKLELEKKILGPKANAFLAEDLKPRPPPPVPGATVVNAPTSVVNANSSSNTTTSTPVRQPNAVIGMIATAG